MLPDDGESLMDLPGAAQPGMEGRDRHANR